MSVPLRSGWHRLYADFMMPSRLHQYRAMLESFLAAGYMVVSVEAFWRLITKGDVESIQRHVVLRHDIDTDPATGREMWTIERDLGIHGSYFFRLSTVDVSLMQAIEKSGSSASYHYEDLATVAKRRRIRTQSDAYEHIPEAQDSFRRNIERLRGITGLPMRVVASHGDFVNRKLGVPNWVILADESFRRDSGVDLETYDDSFMARMSCRHRDTLHPTYWIPEDPLAAIARNEAVIHILVHPRHWRVARAVNAKDDVVRLVEGFRYNLPIGLGAG